MVIATQTTALDKDVSREFALRGVGTLVRGRTPFAGVDIYGVGIHKDIIGRADFYYTPLGMLVCVSVKGLSGEGGVYSLSFVADDGRAADMGIRCAIPPLYDRNGYAWCSALTGKIFPSEIVGSRMVMRALNRNNDNCDMAKGVVRSFIEESDTEE